MENLIPDKFNVSGDLIVRFDKNDTQEILVTLALLILIIMILGFLAQRFIRKV